MIATDQVPVGTKLDPFGANPLSVDPAAADVKTNAPVTSPGPASTLAVAVALSEVPICTRALPTAMAIAVQHSVLVTMMSNALVAVGSAPLCAAVQAVIVPVAAIQVPVITGCDLVVTGPPLLVR